MGEKVCCKKVRGGRGKGKGTEERGKGVNNRPEKEGGVNYRPQDVGRGIDYMDGSVPPPLQPCSD